MEQNVIFHCLDSSEEMRSVSHKWRNLIRAVAANPASVGMSFVTGPPPAFFTMDDVSDSPASHNHTLHGILFQKMQESETKQQDYRERK